MLKCEVCNRNILELSEEEALDDLESHGWSNWETAQHIKCFDCATDNDAYETYYAGRIKKKYPNRVYRKMPDIQNPNNTKEIETYHMR